jgi:L-lysine 6-transaminase
MKTVLNIKIDFEKSNGSYVFDKNTQEKYLDFFGMFSTLPLGYNHNIFDESFDNKVRIVSKLRMANNLFQSDEYEAFVKEFKKHIFSENIHFTCTGSLAVEAAIKCAIEYKKTRTPMVIAIKKSFHGINSWGFITDRYLGTGKRIENFPQNDWKNLSIDELIDYVENRNINDLVAVVIEPIQCTAGDIYLDPEKLIYLRSLCKAKDICYIVDEIQTGFGVTGEMWYSDTIGLNPDILIFGKKSQICGIVATNKYSECMISPFRKLEVTYDGELIDMIRATYILKAFEKYDLLNRAKQNNKIFTEILKNKVLNYRSLGHLISFDFETMEERDQFIEFCYTKKLLCNKGGDQSIRMRPNLAVTEDEIKDFEFIINEIL